MTNPVNAKTTEEGRSYTWPGDDPPITYDSVTTVLKGGIPMQFLSKWAAKLVAEFVYSELCSTTEPPKDVLKRWATVVQDDCEQHGRKIPANRDAALRHLKGQPWAVRDAAADIGTRVHEAIEAHVLGKPMPEWDADIRGHMVSFEKFLKDFRPTFELSEATVYNRAQKVAGTLDAIMVVPGIGRLLVDAKSGKGIYPEVALQLAAYRRAEFIGMPDGSEQPVPEVDGCAVLHIRSDGYEFLPVEAGEAEWRYFLHALWVHRFCSDHGKTVIGKPHEPPSSRPVAPVNVEAMVG